MTLFAVLYSIAPSSWLFKGETRVAVVEQTAIPFNTTLSLVASSGNRQPIENIQVSSLGQLAFTVGGILYVETRPGAREYMEIGRYVRAAAWSPDGKQLAYSQQSSAEPYDPTAVYEQRLWSAVDYSDISLAERIPDYPAVPYLAHSVQWSPDGAKILMDVSQSNAATFTGTSTVVMATADLYAGTYNQTSITLRSGPVPIIWPVWLTNDQYVLQQSCGSPCAHFFAFDYTGQRLWAIQSTQGAVAYGRHGAFFINAGSWLAGNPRIETIDLSTGAVAVLWEKPKTTSRYLAAFVEPSLSPDEQLITFNFGRDIAGPGSLYVLDRNGQEQARYADTFLLDWRSNHELAVKEMLDSGENRLAYRSLEGAYEVILTTSDVIKDGVWSPDGNIFVFMTYRLDNRTYQLYFWQPDRGEPQLIYSAAPNQYLIHLSWLPNSKGVYFAVEGSSFIESLWLAEVEIK